MSRVAGCRGQARRALAAGALALVACEVAAVPVCELSVVGQDCVLNIDVRGRGTGPYDLLLSSIGTSIIPGSTVTFEFFDELNAAGPVAVSVGPTVAASLADWPVPDSALWNDGQASLRVTLDSGGVTYNFIEAFYVDATGTRYASSFVPSALPAPPTMALLALAALAAVAARRGRAHPPVTALPARPATGRNDTGATASPAAIG